MQLCNGFSFCWVFHAKVLTYKSGGDGGSFMIVSARSALWQRCGSWFIWPGFVCVIYSMQGSAWAPCMQQACGCTDVRPSVSNTLPGGLLACTQCCINVSHSFSQREKSCCIQKIYRGQPRASVWLVLCATGYSFSSYPAWFSSALHLQSTAQANIWILSKQVFESK